MPLTDREIKALQPQATPKRHSDGDGLYLIVRPSGAKWWRFSYTFHGRRKGLSFGTFKKVTLLEARQKRHEAQMLLKVGTDPSRHRMLTKAAAHVDALRTFNSVGEDWFARIKPHYTPRTQVKTAYLLKAYLYPAIGAVPISSLEPPVVLQLLRTIEKAGRYETAHRVKQICGQVCQSAILMGWAVRNPVADLRGALMPVRATNRAAITVPAEIGALLRAIDGYHGSALVAAALQLLALTFVRPGELRLARWEEFDLAHALWRVPAARMKGRQMHTVPLATQALAVLAAIKPLTAGSAFLFPSLRTNKRPMSDNTFNAALRRLGYDKTQVTAHGFRAMASTRLNEMGFDPDVVEAQLAHSEKDTVRAAYHRAKYLPERTAMVQAYANELDRLRAD